MTDDSKLRMEMFMKFRDAHLVREASNSESFDRAVLALASSILGASLAFGQHISSLAAHAPCAMWLLRVAWCLFGTAVVSTIISILTSQSSIRKQIDLGERYYLNRDEHAFNAFNGPAIATRFLNLLSGIAFALAVVLVVVFISIVFP